MLEDIRPSTSHFIILDDYSYLPEGNCILSKKEYGNLIEAKEACSSQSSCVGILEWHDNVKKLCTGISIPLVHVEFGERFTFEVYRKKNLPGIM